MVLLGHRPVAEHILQIAPQVPVNLSVIRTTLGMVAVVLLVREHSLVQRNQQIRCGIQYQVLRKHGTEAHGHQQIQQVTIRQLQLQHVDIPVQPTTLGMVAVVLLVREHSLVQRNQQIRCGIQYQVLRKHGTEAHGHQQIQQVTIRQLQLQHVDIPVQPTTLGMVAVVLPTQK